MTLSVSVVGSRRGWVRPGVPPERLREAGILTDPATPDGAYRRARGLVGEGFYRQARLLLHPHLHTAPMILRPQIQELLGLCCARCGGDWQGPLQAALAHHEWHRDVSAQARILRHQGEIALMQGRFAAARECFAAAHARYAEKGDARAYQIVAMQGRLALRAGNIRESLRRLDEAIAAIAESSQPRTEALARLDRARALAAMGDAGTCARELITAERLLSSNGDRGDHLRTRLARAETLLVFGEHDRAARGLVRLRHDTLDCEDMFTRASVHLLLGQAIARTDAAEARRHLMRGSHHYRAIDAELGVANCQLELARVDALLGLNPRGRIYGLSLLPLTEWPSFAAELVLVEAEVMWGSKTATKLENARALAIKCGHRALARRIDALLSARGLTPEEVTPLGDEPTLPHLMSGPQRSPTTAHRPGTGPQLIEEDSPEAYAQRLNPPIRSALPLPPPKRR